MPTNGAVKYALCPSCNDPILDDDPYVKCAICKCRTHISEKGIGRSCIVSHWVPDWIDAKQKADICHRCGYLVKGIEGFDECVKKAKHTFKEMEGLKAKADIDVQRLEDKIQSLYEPPLWSRLLPVVAIALALLLTVYLVYKGWAQKPEISIQYNVGEIIGGLLVGLGAIIAALTYAGRRRKPPERPQG